MARDRLSSRAVSAELHSASVRLLRRLRAVDREAPVGPARLSALSILVMAGPQTIGRLAELEQVRAPTMTRIVAGLERDGLASRRPDPDDARVVWIHASPAGAKLLRAARRRRERELEGLLSGLSARDLRTLSDAAALVRTVLERPR